MGYDLNDELKKELEFLKGRINVLEETVLELKTEIAELKEAVRGGSGEKG